MSGLQNIMFTKCQVSKRLVSKRPVFNFDILVKQKVLELPSLHSYLEKRVYHFYLLLAIMVIYGKKTL
jgi:hypothetical protein